MTDWAFVEFMNKLKSTYGEKSYPTERTAIIADKLRVLHDEDLKIVVRELIANSRHAPMASDIVKAAERLLDMRFKEEHWRKVRELEERKAKGLSCEHCGDAGLISAWRRETPYSFSFGCPDHSCVAARIHCNRNDVRWSNEFLEQYLPVFTKDSKSDLFEKASPNWIAERDQRIQNAKAKKAPMADLTANALDTIRQGPVAVASVLDEQRAAHTKVLEKFSEGAPIFKPEGPDFEQNDALIPF